MYVLHLILLHSLLTNISKNKHKPYTFIKIYFDPNSLLDKIYTKMKIHLSCHETSLPLKKEFINEETWKHYLILS